MLVGHHLLAGRQLAVGRPPVEVDDGDHPRLVELVHIVLDRPSGRRRR